ncbi:MAG: protein-disulfide reductase DsbD domain-containing protein [Sphingomonadales bacterium]
MAALRCIIATMLALVFAIAPLPAMAANHIAVELVSEAGPLKPGGTITLAIVMRPEAGWHGYWKNPGDAGVETQATWTLPEGVTAGPLQYPVPTTLLVGGLMNYVYEGEHALLVNFKLPANLPANGALPISVKLDWLACTKEICVPESGTFETQLGAGDIGAGFARWRAAMPRPMADAAHFAVEGGKVRVGIPLPASASIDGAYFFPLVHGVLDYAAPQVVARDGDRLVVETKLAEGATKPAKLDGVLRFGAGQGLTVSATPGTVLPVAKVSESLETVGIAIGAAVLGGLLLNIMPCVFPILSLKALGLARSGGSARGARREALAYTVGAIVTCAALGGALLGLRASGAAVGWAFQLQNPWVIAVLLVLVSAIALNLGGLFELPTLGGGDALTRQEGAAGAFWTGALAAFVATPCTGPFMGAALGAALVLPPAAAMGVFVGLGFGLALPFLLIGFIPPLRRLLPKPGAWMDTFRRIMAVPMFLTALALAWVLGKLGGVDAMTWGLIATMFVAMTLWWVGRRQARGKPDVWWPLVGAAAVLLASIAILSRPAAPGLASEPFSEARLASLTAAGRPVFVYFTADWCVTCKVNEQAAIERSEVVDAFAKTNTAVLVGDWTRGDAAISRFLTAHGRSGVPLYLYYKPGTADPQVLPQVLTVGTLTALGT